MVAIIKKSKPKKPALQKYNDEDRTTSKSGGISAKKFNIFKKGK